MSICTASSGTWKRYAKCRRCPHGKIYEDLHNIACASTPRASTPVCHNHPTSIFFLLYGVLEGHVGSRPTWAAQSTNQQPCPMRSISNSLHFLKPFERTSWSERISVNIHNWRIKFRHTSIHYILWQRKHHNFNKLLYWTKIFEKHGSWE